MSATMLFIALSGSSWPWEAFRTGNDPGAKTGTLLCLLSYSKSLACKILGIYIWASVFLFCCKPG